MFLLPLLPAAAAGSPGSSPCPAAPSGLSRNGFEPSSALLWQPRAVPPPIAPCAGPKLSADEAAHGHWEGSQHSRVLLRLKASLLLTDSTSPPQATQSGFSTTSLPSEPMKTCVTVRVLAGQAHINYLTEVTLWCYWNR